MNAAVRIFWNLPVCGVLEGVRPSVAKMLTHAGSRWSDVTCRRCTLELKMKGAFVLLFVLAIQSCEQPRELPAGVSVGNAWLREMPFGTTVAAGYVEISNDGEEDRLVSADAHIAERVELHTSYTVGNTVQTRPIANGIRLPTAGSVRLSPGEEHIMLFGLERPLRRGEVVSITLTFERAGTIAVPFKIRRFDHAHDAGSGLAKPA
jgi:copper(I)-binding protein